jgi:hypothetical protein
MDRFTIVKPSNVLMWSELYGNDLELDRTDSKPLIYDTNYFSDGTKRDLINHISIFNKEYAIGQDILANTAVDLDTPEGMSEFEFCSNIYLALRAELEYLKLSPSWATGRQFYVIDVYLKKMVSDTNPYGASDVGHKFYDIPMAIIYARLLSRMKIEEFELESIKKALENYLLGLEKKYDYDYSKYGFLITTPPIFPDLEF